MNWLADYKTLLFNNELLHLPFFSLPHPPTPHFLHPIQFWLPTPNNLSPLNDMQMNFHEPHDPKRWLNRDDISCHAAATVTVSVCLLSPYLDHLSWSPRQRPTGLRGLIVVSPLWIFLLWLYERWHSAYLVLFQTKFVFFFLLPLELINVCFLGCGSQRTAATSNYMLEQYTIGVKKKKSSRWFWWASLSSSSTPSAPLPPFHLSLEPAPPLLSFIVLHLHNEARA